MKTAAAAILALAILLASCSSTPPTSLEDSGPISYQVQTSYSGDDYVVHRLVIYRDDEDTVELGVISPNDNSANSYALSVVYTGDTWRFMEGEVLIRVGSEAP